MGRRFAKCSVLSTSSQKVHEVTAHFWMLTLTSSFRWCLSSVTTIMLLYWSFVISKYLVWKCFEAMEIIHCFSNFCLLASMDNSCQILIFLFWAFLIGLPWLLRWESICLQCGRPRFEPCVMKIPWRRKWQPSPVFIPRTSHGPRSLVGYSPWGCSLTQLSDFSSPSSTFISCTPIVRKNFFGGFA